MNKAKETIIITLLIGLITYFTIYFHKIPSGMTEQMLIASAVLFFAIISFIREWFRVDMVGLIMMVALPLLGLVTPAQALSGLSSNAVISILAVIIIGAGLDRTGVMNILAKGIIKIAGKNQIRITSLISATVAFISSFMQNIGAAALFLPATTRISKRLKIPISKILMPMGFSAIIGGCLTLVGSSPLILMNDVMSTWWNNNSGAIEGKEFEPFGLFSVTPVGITLIVMALLYFAILGKFILPNSKCEEDDSCFLKKDLQKIYAKGVSNIFEFKVPRTFESQTIRKLQLRETYFCQVVAISSQKGPRRFAVTRGNKISANDTIVLSGTDENIKRLVSDLNWKLKPELEVFAEELSPSNAGIREGIIGTNSPLVGKTMKDVEFRSHYKIVPLAIYRNNKIIVKHISSTELQSGDVLLLFGTWERFHDLKNTSNLVFSEKIPGEKMRPKKAKWAVIFLVLALVLALIFKVQLSIALLTGAIGMILSRVLTIDEAYKSVDWMTIFLLGGLIPLGIAFETTGTAKFIATTIVSSLGTVSPIVLYFVIGLLTTFFTLVASNVGATVLLIPLAMNMSISMGADPRIAAMVVAVAASNTFILPTHQVNALIMRPGGYKTMDYVRAGSGMTILYLIVMIAAITLFF